IRVEAELTQVPALTKTVARLERRINHPHDGEQDEEQRNRYRRPLEYGPPLEDRGPSKCEQPLKVVGYRRHLYLSFFANRRRLYAIMKTASMPTMIMPIAEAEPRSLDWK